MRGLTTPLTILAAALMGCSSPLTLEVDGTAVVMRGELNSDSPAQVKKLLQDNPELETIIMADVPGSLDDVAALEAARLVRDAGLHTEVPADGEIASGGVDLFLAGTQRTVAEGGKVGVHSWSDRFTEGSQVPRDDPEHTLYLDYYADMGIREEFYWFTLNAADSRDIHWMTRDELEEHVVVTR